MFPALLISLFFVSLWAAERHCPTLRPPPHGSVTYVFDGKPFGCRHACPVSTVASLECATFYVTGTNATTTCMPHGQWSAPLRECILDCGKTSTEVSLIVNGLIVSPGAFPWHTAIYNFIDASYEYWCGGSLISRFAVLTAAHCTWKMEPENLLLAFGKFHRKMKFEERDVQMIKARKIKILESYQDASGNYNGDLSVIFLKEGVVFNDLVMPVCLDWDGRFVDEQLKEGTLGTVLGWGLTENNTFSDYLRISNLPVTSDEKCIAEQEADFKKFVTYTSFCAGFRNGTGVCNGDSGGGLAFFHKSTGRWYLQGLVSVSPRRRGTTYCDTNFYTVFTRVSAFTKWLQKLKIFDENINGDFEDPLESQTVRTPEKQNQSIEKARDPYQFVRHFFQADFLQTSKKIFNFPHTKKLIEFALLSNRTK